MKKKTLGLALLVGLSAITLASCGGKKKPAETTTGNNTSEVVISEFKVTFKNFDGNELYSYTAKKGDIAKYSGQTPERTDGDYFASYVFDGWDKPLGEVTENVVYTAKYKVVYSTTYYSNGLLFELSKDQKGWFIRKYLGSDENVVVPATFDGLPVTTILSGAFSNNTFIKTIHIGDNISYIGENAFLNMEKIENITVSDKNHIFSIEDDALIGTYVNENGDKIKSLIYMPSTRTGFYEIPEDVSVYRGCLSGSHLNDLKFSTNVFKPINPFYYADPMTPNIINSQYSNYIFKDLFGGTEQDVNNADVIHVIVSGGDIPAGMFANNKKLESISLYENEENPISEIGNLAFYGCSSVKSMVIPNSVETIRRKAFQNCNFKTLSIGRDMNLKLNLVEDYGLFCDVEETTISNGLQYVGNEENPYVLAFAIDPNITRPVDSDSVVSINQYTLFLRDELLMDPIYAPGVEKFVFGSAKIRSIGSKALYFVTKKISLPSTVNYIGATPIFNHTILDSDSGFYYFTDSTNNKYVVGATGSTLSIDSTTKFITTNVFSAVNDIDYTTSGKFRYSETDKLLYTRDYRTLLFCNSDNESIVINQATKNIGSFAFNSSEVETIEAYDLEFFDDNAFVGYSGTEVLEINYKYADGKLIDNRFNDVVYLSTSAYTDSTCKALNVGNKLAFFGTLPSAVDKKLQILENDDYSVLGVENKEKIKFDHIDKYSYYEKIYASLGFIKDAVAIDDDLKQ